MDIQNPNILVHSYGTLFGTNEDASNYVTKARRIWMNTFLELFKTLLEKHVDILPEDANTQTIEFYYEKVLDPIIGLINETKDKELSAIVDLNADKRDLNADYFDFDSELSVTRIANPTTNDICPDIKISETAFMEHVVNKYTELTGIEFPYTDIPIMTIYPSISGVYNFGKMYSKYIDSGKNKKRETYNAIVEISRKSIMLDYADLEKEYNTVEKTLTDSGMELLKSVVIKYTDFVVPMICINLRRDYHQYTNFISNMYNNFCNNYQSSLRLQKDMYLIFQDVISSPIGVNLAFVYSTQFATSSIEFMNPNCKHGGMLTELNTIFDKPYLTEYMEYVRPFNSVYEGLTSLLQEELQAYSNLVTTNTNRLFDYIVTYFNTNGADKKINKIQELTMHAFTELLSSLTTSSKYGVHSLLFDTIKNFVDSLDFNNIRNVLITISKKMGRAIDVLTPGNNSNRAALGPYPVIDEELMRRNYTFMGTSSAAAEGNDIIKDILFKKCSNACMNNMGARFESVASFEDAMGILMECKGYLEVFNMSTVAENAETKQFGAFLKNSIRYAEEAVENFKVNE